jgi:hypothetical protein
MCLVANWTFDNCSKAEKDIVDKGKLTKLLGDKRTGYFVSSEQLLNLSSINNHLNFE